MSLIQKLLGSSRDPTIVKTAFGIDALLEVVVLVAYSTGPHG